MYKTWDDKSVEELLVDQTTIQRELLDQILTELKIMNIHFASMTGEEVTEIEIEEEHY